MSRVGRRERLGIGRPGPPALPRISTLATPGADVVIATMTAQNSRRFAALKRCFWAGVMLAAMGPAGAVERTLTIQAPASIRAGQELKVTISASTDAGKGEQVGFLQAEASLDGGRTWVAVCYLQKSGPQVEQQASLKPGPAGTTVILRARAAFRDGLAGDVDYSGAAVRWEESWKKWQSPPAKQASIAVRAI